MKIPVLACLLWLLPTLLFCQNADPVLDSLKRPLPANSTVQAQAIQLKNILQHILYNRNIGFGDYPGKLDSLYRCCVAGKTGDWRFEMWVEALSAYYTNVASYDDSEEDIRILKKAMRQFEILGDSNMVGTVLSQLCYYTQSAGDSLTFTNYQHRAIGVSPHMDDLFLRWRMITSLGFYCKTFGKYAEALEYYFEAYALIENEKTTYAMPLQRNILRHICISYREFNEFDTAFFYLEKSTQYGKEDIISESEYYMTLADLHWGKKDYQKALDAYNLTKPLPDQPAYRRYNADIMASKAECYRQLGDPHTGLLWAQKAVAMFPAKSGELEGALMFKELAECELALGMTDLALKHALLAYNFSLIRKTNIVIFKSAQLLSKVYKAKKDFRKAFEFHEIASKYLEKTELTRNAQLIAGKTFERNNIIKTARREAEVQAQLQQQRNIRYALFAGLAVLALLAYLLYNRYRLKQRSTAQLEAKNREVEAARLRAEKSEAFKSRFLANMSHEIRTPLHGIAGFTDLVLETSLTEKQRRYLSAIHHSTERLTEVVNDILDISKLEAGEVKLRQVPFSPARIAYDVQEALSIRAENKDIELSVHVGEGVPEAVLGDPTRLYQILMNLVGNAVKFTSVGSVQLTVYSPQLAVDSSQPPDGSPLKSSNTQNLSRPSGILEYSVSDTGIGIPAEKLASIFDSFQQASDDTTARFGGTGLGLTIARELVQLYGSDIAVKSEVGKGSTFSFTLALPLANAADLKQTGGTSGDLNYSQKLKILLADDNAFNREIATEALLRHFENAEIVEALDGREAVVLWGQQDFDLILMDMQMPEMNGLDATQYIRQHFTGAKQTVPIIALTASATPEEIEKMLAAGMNRHLAKPFKPMELAKVIGEVLGLAVGKDFPSFKSLESLSGSPIPYSSSPIPSFDLGFLRDFCDGDEAQVQHFIQKFQAQCTVEIERLEAAFENQDREAIYQAAHSFKPQLEFVGLKAAALMLADMEQAVREEQSLETLSRLFEQFKEFV